MTRFTLAGILVAAVAAVAAEPYAVIDGPEGSVKAQLFSDRDASLAVARVDGTPVTLRDFSEALAEIHSAHGGGDKAGRKDFRPVLDRLIGARLIALEAHEMGLDELPAIRKSVGEYAEMALRDVLQNQITKDARPDASEVERAYRDAVREWKLRSVLFAREADARAAAASIKGGRKFDEVIAEATAAKKGASTPSEDYVGAAKMLPQVAVAAEGLFAGQVSEPVQVPDGWAIFRIEDIRYPDDAAERARAEARALDLSRSKALKAWYEALVKKVSKTDRALLRNLNFQVKDEKAYARLEKDRRVISRVQDEKDITVGVLAKAMRESFFHGVEGPIKEKRVNDAKYPVFNKLLYREVLDAEARRRHVDQSEPYRRAVGEYRESLVFGAFVEKAILPGLKVSEEDGKAYYASHSAEFAIPAMYRLESIAFPTAKQAQSAYEKLKAGTDFKWLKANADKQVPEERRALDFAGTTLSATALPQALVPVLKGTKPGDLRIFAIDGQHLVLRVMAAAPEQQQPYPSVRERIAKKLAGEKVNKAVEEWVAKLRKAHDVKVYVSQVGS